MTPTLRSSAPPVLTGPRRFPGWSVALLVLGLGVLIVIATVEPAGQAFYPRCWLYQTTGLQCPGCGATRAAHALLNGQFRLAFQYNALVVLAVPGLIWWFVRGVRGGWSGRWWPDPLRHPLVVSTFLGLALGYGFGRNLPW